ncbi:hypothetical protein GX50_01603 [[Emmonsia] crescens]|uniref:Uncharacterized protein n=1 Tax=[Emmonsia] crescens TaxID=73230 RepID=A0A2B7ZQ57_9EURO|nr:hypothetical protein GX50_01603 [Emmonsia crescens]
MTRATISESAFKNSLLAVVDPKCRNYTNSFGLHMRFEADNTRASDDAIHFQTLLHVLGLNRAEEYIIPQQSKCPQCPPLMRFMDILVKAKQCSGRSIVLVHYAGHAFLDRWKQLAFRANNNHKNNNNDNDNDGEEPSLIFQFESFLNIVDLDGPLNDPDCQVDVVFILDFCYNYDSRHAETLRHRPAIAPEEKNDRIVEVLAASVCETTRNNLTDFERNDTTYDEYSHIRMRDDGHTFTSKLAEYVTQLDRLSDFLEFSDMLSYVRAEWKSLPNAREPVYNLIRGLNSIRISFPGSGPDPPPVPPTLSSSTSSSSTTSVFSSSSSSPSSISTSPLLRWSSADYRALFSVDVSSTSTTLSGINWDAVRLVFWILEEIGSWMKITLLNDICRGRSNSHDNNYDADDNNNNNDDNNNHSAFGLNIEAPYVIFTQLNSLPAVHLIREIPPANSESHAFLGQELLEM